MTCTNNLFCLLLPSQNAEGYVLVAVYLFIYLFIYMHVISTHSSKSIQPNHMTFGGMIGYYPMDICDLILGAIGSLEHYNK